MLITNSLFCQKVTFNIKNPPRNSELLFKTLTDDLLKTVYVKSEKTDANIDLEEGYYLLQKEEDEVLLYLKRTDDFVINFDAKNFYKSIEFTGKGADRNTFLLRKKLSRLNAKGKISNYYKKDFYEGNENEYLKRLDDYYNGLYNRLFSDGFDKSFVDAEMKNLKYGYSLDLLKFEEAKKHYKFNDSITISNSFLEPLNYIHFDKPELTKQFYSYKNLAVLKWKKDIQKSEDLKMMQRVLNGIRIESIKRSVLESLYNDMHKENPLTEEYYKLIIENSLELRFKSKVKSKYSEIRQVDAERRLSKFRFKNSMSEKVSLSQFKGNYIFISVWMSNCKKCIKIFKDIEKLRKKYKKNNIIFVGVSVDKEEKFNDWVTIIQENNIEDNQLFFTGSKLKIVEKFNISSLPSYVILSLNGDVINAKIDKPTSRNTKKIIDKLLKEQ